MPDDKSGRDKQAQDAEKRQRERELAEELERMDEPEPEIEAEELSDIEAGLASVSFPATGAEVVEAVGEEQIELPDETMTAAQLLPDAETEEFQSSRAVRGRLQRPTVATAMKRIAEACEAHQGVDLGGSRATAYEKTFRRLRAIDPTDDDEGISVVTDWTLEHLEEKEQLPGSRAVRRRAAKYCRNNGYPVSNDDWLGI